MDLTLDEIMFSWKEDHEGHVIPIDSDERVMSIVNLLNNLKKMGKDDDFLRGSTLKKKILEASVGPKSEGKKRDGWEKAVNNDILRALKKIGLIPSLEDLRHQVVQTATIYPCTHKIVSSGDKTEEPEEQTEKRYGKEVDMSLFSGAPKPDVEWDLEFCKLIGYNPNE